MSYPLGMVSRMPFTFVHAADLHLDSPFRAVRADERLRERLQDSTFGALRGLVELCLREKAAFLLLAGDLFDTKDRSVRARLVLRRELARLDAAGIRTFIVHGNHDPLSGEGQIAWPASVKVFGPTWEEVEVPVEGGVCRVQGVSYPQEKVTENLARRFSRQGPELTIGLLHANVGGASGHANYAPCSLGDLDERRLDYWALGHVHTRAEHLLPSGGVAAYPGNLQGRHALETGPRGCLVVSVDGQRLGERRFVALDRVRWHQVTVDVTALRDPGALMDAAEAAIDAAVEQAPELEAHAVRLILEGESASALELSRVDAFDQLSRELTELCAARPLPVLLEGVEDATRPPLDLPRIRQDGALGAEVLSVADQAVAHPSAVASLWAGELDTLDGRLKKAGMATTQEKAAALLEKAAARALVALGEGG